MSGKIEYRISDFLLFLEKGYELETMVPASEAPYHKEPLFHLLGTIQTDLYNFDDEKKMRIIWNVNDYMLKHPITDKLQGLLRRITDMVSNYKNGPEHPSPSEFFAPLQEDIGSYLKKG